MKKILVICAHPDDETLGLGGMIKIHTLKGAKVQVLIFTDGESSRKKSSRNIIQRKKQAEKAAKELGIQKIKFLGYEDQKLDSITIIELAKHIEESIIKFNPDTVFTHFWGDVNQDHRRVFEATQIATRPTSKSNIDRLICYETPSSTEWSYQNFKPNLYVDIEKVLKSKLKALDNYKKEMGKFPHPRSKEAIIHRSTYWGISAGIKNAEAFLVIRDIIR